MCYKILPEKVCICCNFDIGVQVRIANIYKVCFVSGMDMLKFLSWTGKTKDYLVRTLQPLFGVPINVNHTLPSSLIMQ